MAVKKLKVKKPLVRHKHPAEFIKYCKSMLKELQHLLHLEEYKITVKPVEVDEADRNGMTEMASVTIDTVYLNVTLYLRPALRELWKNCKYEEICVDLIHEMVHVFIEPVWVEGKRYAPGGADNQALTDTVERQTQRLAQAIRSILPSDFHEPSRRKPI